jgi:hypothetical protein
LCVNKDNNGESQGATIKEKGSSAD